MNRPIVFEAGDSIRIIQEHQPTKAGLHGNVPKCRSKPCVQPPPENAIYPCTSSATA
jgi:hypothetical protein